MKRNSTFLNFPGRVTVTALTAGLAVLLAGCTQGPQIKVAPIARIQNVSAQKIPLHVGLMLDRCYCTNSFKYNDGIGDTMIFDFGPVLQQHTISLCQQTFDQVAVSTNGVVPGGMDAVLTPEAHRYGFAIGAGGGRGYFTVLQQWTLRSADNQNLLWMTTVSGQADEGVDKLFQLLFDDLATKSYRAFQESPEIKLLITKKSGTAL